MSIADDMKAWMDVTQANILELKTRLEDQDSLIHGLALDRDALEARVAKLEAQVPDPAPVPWWESWEAATGQVPMVTNTAPAGKPTDDGPMPVVLEVGPDTPVIDGGRRDEIRPRAGDTNNIEREPWGRVNYKVVGQVRKAPESGRAVLVQFHGTADPGDGKGANPVLALELHYGRLRLVHTVQKDRVQTGVDRTIYELPWAAPFSPFQLEVAADWQPWGQGSLAVMVNNQKVFELSGAVTHANEQNCWWSVGPYQVASDDTLQDEWRLRIDEVRRTVR